MIFRHNCTVRVVVIQLEITKLFILEISNCCHKSKAIQLYENSEWTDCSVKQKGVFEVPA